MLILWSKVYKPAPNFSSFAISKEKCWPLSKHLPSLLAMECWLVLNVFKQVIEANVLHVRIERHPLLRSYRQLIRLAVTFDSQPKGVVLSAMRSVVAKLSLQHLLHSSLFHSSLYFLRSHPKVLRKDSKHWKYFFWIAKTIKQPCNASITKPLSEDNAWIAT